MIIRQSLQRHLSYHLTSTLSHLTPPHRHNPHIPLSLWTSPLCPQGECPNSLIAKQFLVLIDKMFSIEITSSPISRYKLTNVISMHNLTCAFLKRLVDYSIQYKSVSEGGDLVQQILQDGWPITSIQRSHKPI